MNYHTSVYMLYMFCSVLVASTYSQNVGHFWHVTDFHYDTTYDDLDLSCNSEVDVHGKYGDYWCDSPFTLVQSAIDFMAQKTKEINGVDFAIWTGDTVAHIKDDKTDLENNLAIIENITNSLTSALPSIPVYASLGNHDFFPDGQAPYQHDEFYVRVSSMWENWMRGQSKVDNFTDGGFYSTILPNSSNILLLALNTNLYYTSNKLTPTIEDPAGQFSWIEEQLQQAESVNQKVIVTGHVPPGLLTPDLVEWFYPAHKRRFMDILFKYSHIITVLHFGHDHEDGFKVLQNKDRSKAVTQFSAPSVTPWRYKFPNAKGEMQTGDPHNPAVRLVKYDRTTGAQLDYTQYYLDLTKANRVGAAHFVKLYDFTEAYDVTDMSVSSLRTIFDRLKDGKGREYLDKYCQFGLVNTLQNHCTDQMRGEIYCGGILYNATEASVCVEDYLRVNNGSGVKVQTLIFIFSGLIFVAAVLGHIE